MDSGKCYKGIKTFATLPFLCYTYLDYGKAYTETSDVGTQSGVDVGKTVVESSVLQCSKEADMCCQVSRFGGLPGLKLFFKEIRYV